MNRYSLILCFFLAPPALALEQTNVTAPLALSDQVPDFGQAYKTKLLSMGNGTLVAVYGDAVENAAAHYVFDMRANAERPARDVFVRACDAKNLDCSNLANWSTPVNISNTALLSSIDTDWNADGSRTAYYGDSDKPNAYASGSHLVVSWGDKYCPGGAQRTVIYPDFNNREIPMSCLYVAHNSGDISDPGSWTVNQLSDASRDVKQDVNRGLSSGAWSIVWQEDPLGLQPGEAEGPGEGSSGAHVSPGTDIWYSYSTNVKTAGGDIGVWKTPVRITDNQIGYGLPDNIAFNPVRDSAGTPVPPTSIDKGVAGASRANLALVGGSSPPKAVVAYEETKAASGLEQGKFVRYQTFNYNSPPTDLICNPANYENCRVGCIVSNPAENARRARLVTQTKAGTSGLRWALFWREGIYNQGGPADIMLRLGYTDFTPANLVPAVDQPSCYAPDISSAINLSNNAALNISSNTLTASPASLLESSSANLVENARAHRAVLRGDFLNMGYIYTPDWLVAETTDLENYNFYIRHFDATTGVWANPVNLSQITDTSINVKEPRLMGPPGSRGDCADPLTPVDARDCQNKNVIVAAWGTETNVYPYMGSGVPLDIFITRSTDRAASFEPTIVLAGGPDEQTESQINISPSGTEIYAVWNQTDTSGAVDAMYSQITAETIPVQIAIASPDKVFKGDEFTVTITVTNNLVKPDTGIVVTTATLPTAVTFVSATATGGSVNSCSEAAGIVTCDIGDLGVDASATITLKLSATTSGDATIAASAVSDNDTTPESSSANFTITTPVSTSDSGGGFCSYHPNGKFDPVLPLLLVTGLIYVARRRKLEQQSK